MADLNEIYRGIRKQVRKLSYRESLEVIWAYAQFLQVRNFRMPPAIEVHRQFREANPPQAVIPEWVLEQLVREVVRHSDEEADRETSLRRWSTLAELVTSLRELEEAIHSEFIPDEKMLLELMRIAHRQFVWQQHRMTWKGIIRYHKLFNTAEIIPICRAATGLTVYEWYLIGMTFIGGLFQNSRWREDVQIVDLPGITPEHIHSFQARVSLKLADLATRLREEHRLDDAFAYRYSSLREFPMIRTQYSGVRELLCPIPTLLYWRMTTGLYYDLRLMAGFPTAFGRSFQTYVGEVLRARMNAQEILPEVEYRVGRNRKHTVDWIVQQNGRAALFLECKTKRLTWASKTGLADLTGLDEDLRKLAGCVVQVYRTTRDYREGRYPNLPFDERRQIYPAVVTLEDWYFFGPELVTRLDRAIRTAMEAADLPIEWLDEMPYSIFSIDEFETSAAIMDLVGVDEFIRGKVRDQERRRWTYHSYVIDRYRPEISNLPPLFRQEYDALFSEHGV